MAIRYEIDMISERRSAVLDLAARTFPPSSYNLSEILIAAKAFLEFVETGTASIITKDPIPEGYYEEPKELD